MKPLKGIKNPYDRIWEGKCRSCNLELKDIGVGRNVRYRKRDGEVIEAFMVVFCPRCKQEALLFRTDSYREPC